MQWPWRMELSVNKASFFQLFSFIFHIFQTTFSLKVRRGLRWPRPFGIFQQRQKQDNVCALFD